MNDSMPVNASVPPRLTVQDILQLQTPPPDARFAYGTDPEQFGELRLPKSSGPHPIAIVIHGGCWRAEFNLQFIAACAAALAKEGIATWNIEYRRVGNPGGGWPGTFDDVARGTRYPRKLVHRYALDLNRVVVVGHSAGGHLALWLAGRNDAGKSGARSLTKPVPLRGVVVLAGVTSLARATWNDCTCRELVGKLMGGSHESLPERYKLASPDLFPSISVPQRLIHGDQDASVPLQMSEDYFNVARQRGDDVQLKVLPGIGHLELIAPDSQAWKLVVETAHKLLEYRK